jgi:formylmethanofuran dehydrogenase subunit E
VKEKIKDCVFSGCTNKAVDRCSVCGIPVCEAHSKRASNGKTICLNCYKFRAKR